MTVLMLISILAQEYYQPVSDRIGPALFKEVSELVAEHQVHSYNLVWGFLEYIHEDPENPDNIIMFYLGRSQPKTTRSGGGPGKDLWQREHVWPKSHGFKKASHPAYTDLHNLVPADRTLNASRGHKDLDDDGSPHHECHECVVDRDSWAPPPHLRGDVARIIFYMATAYPELKIVSVDTEAGEPRFGNLCTLLAWNEMDPVSQSEKDRNDRIYEIQRNRNPYIDHPEWVSMIWECQGDN